MDEVCIFPPDDTVLRWAWLIVEFMAFLSFIAAWVLDHRELVNYSIMVMILATAKQILYRTAPPKGEGDGG